MAGITTALRGVAIVSLLSAIIMPLSVLASSGPRICNRTSEAVEVAIAWWGSAAPGLHSKGWYNIEPGECASVFPNDSYDAHRYYYAESRTWVWKGNDQGTGFCVHPQNRFDIADAYTDCPAPYERHSFRWISGNSLDLDPPK